MISSQDWDVLVKHSFAPLDLKPVDAIFSNLYPAFECQRRDSSWFLTLVPETHICHPEGSEMQINLKNTVSLTSAHDQHRHEAC